MAMMVTSKDYTVEVAIPDDDIDPVLSRVEELHFKERIIVYLCIGLIRAKNRLLLRNYAMIEPFAYFSKGYQQPGRRTIAGGFTSTLPTCWKRIKAIYDKCLPSFNERLTAETRCHGAFDNHQKFIDKKNPTDGKSSINHVGTSFFLKQDRPYSLPKGTRMQSPKGTRFVVEECVQHSDTRFLVKGASVLDHN